MRSQHIAQHIRIDDPNQAVMPGIERPRLVERLTELANGRALMVRPVGFSRPTGLCCSLSYNVHYDEVAMTDMSPTEQAHSQLQAAYDRLNAALFDGALPPCLITLQRKSKRTMGFFAEKRFGAVAGDEKLIDELAMNPQHFRASPPLEILQTLAHEMVHLWQAHFGTMKARRAYHNAEWGAKMEAIGLMPSHTGKPGGRKTGQQMADYAIAGGRFEAVARHRLRRRRWRYRRNAQRKKDQISVRRVRCPNLGQSRIGGCVRALC
jgi:predicted SprT family Zn-dependent metalloprotease